MIREEVRRRLSQGEPHSYYVFTDKLDNDDNGDEQASIYSTSVESNQLLSRNEVIERAEEFGDWKIQYGAGDYARVNSYVIEHRDNTTDVLEDF